MEEEKEGKLHTNQNIGISPNFGKTIFEISEEVKKRSIIVDQTHNFWEKAPHILAKLPIFWPKPQNIEQTPNFWLNSKFLVKLPIFWAKFQKSAKVPIFSSNMKRPLFRILGKPFMKIFLHLWFTLCTYTSGVWNFPSSTSIWQNTNFLL